MSAMRATERIQPSARELQRLREEYLAACEPFQRMIVGVRLYAVPTYAMLPDGTLTVLHDGLSEEARAVIAQCEEAMQRIGTRIEKQVRGRP